MRRRQVEKGVDVTDRRVQGVATWTGACNDEDCSQSVSHETSADNQKILAFVSKKTSQIRQMATHSAKMKRMACTGRSQLVVSFDAKL